MIRYSVCCRCPRALIVHTTKTGDLLTRRGTRSIFPQTRIAERYNTYIKEKWVAGWSKGVRAKGAGRPRPLRSRNDIKVFQEPRARDAPYPTTSQSSHVLPSHSIPPHPRFGLLFNGGVSRVWRTDQ